MYITRRSQDYAEASGDSLILTFLDWEKAFDKVDQKRMIQAMARLNVPNKMLNVLQSLYRRPKFRAKFNEEASDFKTQDSGIRQGCPLSPYLFILLMTVMFFDIEKDVGKTSKRDECNT